MNHEFRFRHIATPRRARRDALPIVERGARATSIDAALERAMARSNEHGAGASRGASEIVEGAIATMRSTPTARGDDAREGAIERVARERSPTMVAIALCGVVAGPARAARPMTGGGGETPRRTRAERGARGVGDEDGA